VNATALKKGLQEFAKLAFGNCTGGVMRRIQFALMDVPYAAVRRHLAANEQIPGSVDDLVRTCYLALMPTMELGTTRIN